MTLLSGFPVFSDTANFTALQQTDLPHMNSGTGAVCDRDFAAALPHFLQHRRKILRIVFA
jgi:hypothetical protein